MIRGTQPSVDHEVRDRTLVLIEFLDGSKLYEVASHQQVLVWYLEAVVVNSTRLTGYVYHRTEYLPKLGLFFLLKIAYLAASMAWLKASIGLLRRFPFLSSVHL